MLYLQVSFYMWYGQRILGIKKLLGMNSPPDLYILIRIQFVIRKDDFYLSRFGKHQKMQLIIGLINSICYDLMVQFALHWLDNLLFIPTVLFQGPLSILQLTHQVFFPPYDK